MANLKEALALRPKTRKKKFKPGERPSLKEGAKLLFVDFPRQLLRGGAPATPPKKKEKPKSK